MKISSLFALRSSLFALMLVSFFSCERDSESAIQLTSEQKEVVQKGILEWQNQTSTDRGQDGDNLVWCDCLYEILEFTPTLPLGEPDYQAYLYSFNQCSQNCPLFYCFFGTHDLCKVPNPGFQDCQDKFLNPVFQPIPYQRFNCRVRPRDTFSAYPAAYWVNNPNCIEAGDIAFTIKFRFRCDPVYNKVTMPGGGESSIITVVYTPGPFASPTLIPLGGELGCLPQI